MNNKIKKLTFAICSSVIYTTSLAQTTPPIVVPINSNVGIGIQAPFLLGIAAANRARVEANEANKENIEASAARVNDSSKETVSNVNKDMPALDNKQDQNTSIETEQEKALKAAVLAKDPKVDDTNKPNAEANAAIFQPKVKVETQQTDRMTGQVPINKSIVRTNDIRLWNDSSIKEKEEIGQKNIVQALEGK